MWMALLIISFLIAMPAFVGIIVGLFRGVARKGWSVLAYSTVIFVVFFALTVVAAEERVATWLVLQMTSFFIGIVALVGILVGLIVGVASRRWTVLACSTIVFAVCLALVVIAGDREDSFSDTERVRRSASATTRNVSVDPNDCTDRFRSRKNAVMNLHNDGLLDAYGLSDIGVLNNYGISVEAAVAIADILDVNGLYGLQNHYDEVAHSICAEVRHDEVLIRDGTREAYVNR